MAYQVFLIPSVLPEDKPVVWQLQLLAEAYGLTIEVARRTKAKVLSNAVENAIVHSDAAVAIITRYPNDAVFAELGAAKGAKKTPLIGLVEKRFHDALDRNRRGHLSSVLEGVVYFDRNQDFREMSGRVQKIVDVLTEAKEKKETKNALLWFFGIAVALFVLGAAFARPDEG